MQIFIGHLDTEHFEFTTYARTEAEARTLMRSAWAIHKKKSGAWLTWKKLKSYVHIEAVEIGSYQIR